MPDFPDSAVVQRMREYQRDLVARDADTIYHMGKRWMQVESALEANISLLAIEMTEEGIENIADIYRMRRYQKLLAQTQTEILKYNLWAAQYVAENQKKYAVLGVDRAFDIVQLTLFEGGVDLFFDRIPVSAVELIASTAGPGGPVYTLLEAAYPTAVENMTNILIQNVALGIGPGETAKAMMNGLAGGLNHVLTVARSEKLRVYREASRQQYVSSGAVQRYKRFASKSGNTCALCLALDGEIYYSKDLMYVHPNDRCGMIPIVNGVKPPQWESGEDWLRKQPLVTQQKILGPGALDLWDKGEIELKDLVKKVEHPLWGPSLARVPLRDLTSP